MFEDFYESYNTLTDFDNDDDDDESAINIDDGPDIYNGDVWIDIEDDDIETVQEAMVNNFTPNVCIEVPSIFFQKPNFFSETLQERFHHQTCCLYDINTSFQSSFQIVRRL